MANWKPPPGVPISPGTSPAHTLPDCFGSRSFPSQFLLNVESDVISYYLSAVLFFIPACCILNEYTPSKPKHDYCEPFSYNIDLWTHCQIVFRKVKIQIIS